MSRVTIERDGLTLVGDREEPFGESMTWLSSCMVLPLTATLNY